MQQADLRNFQNFIQRLDDAIAEQRNATTQAGAMLQLGRKDLYEAQRKMKSFDTLALRHAKSESKRLDLNEQREQDEHSGRISAIKANTAQNEN
jgi:flagellar FliJ protein